MYKPLVIAGCLISLAACSGPDRPMPKADRSPRDSLNNNFNPTTQAMPGATPRDDSSSGSQARGGPGTGTIR